MDWIASFSLPDSPGWLRAPGTGRIELVDESSFHEFTGAGFRFLKANEVVGVIFATDRRRNPKGMIKVISWS